MRHLAILTVVATTAAFFPFLACAQVGADYPNKPVRVIVASGPGGAADIQARMFADKLSENMKRQFVVENRPGAGDTIATAFVAKSAPDGYTLMVAAPSFTLSPALYPSFPHDPMKDFAPISLVARAPLLLLVHPSLPAQSVKELLALARASPGAIDMAVSQGSHVHLASVYFASMANIKVTPVPYNSGAQVVIDTVGGQVPMAFVNILAALPHVRSGRLRALGVSSAERSPVLPQLPTISETGVRGYDVSAWSGWFAPAGTSAAIVGKLNAELAKAAQSPDVTKRLMNDGGEPVGTSPEQFRQLIAEEVPRWRKIVKDASIRLE